MTPQHSEDSEQPSSVLAGKHFLYVQHHDIARGAACKGGIIKASTR